MNLLEALEILKQDGAESPAARAFLACGFTPLHLKTFLAAHLKKLSPRQKFEIETGLFGDLVGNIDRARNSGCGMFCVVVEWQDLDSRLGIRTLGGWNVTQLPDILKSAGNTASRLGQALGRAAEIARTYVCLPTLPLPPVSPSPTRQSDSWTLQLRQVVSSLAVSLSNHPRITILNSQWLDESSPMHARLDIKSELTTGFPYKLSHASKLSELLAISILGFVPKKGLITDLDDTLWSGIVGEVGIEGISWNLDNHAQQYGLFQQFLMSLASTGVLLAVASKNDAELVKQAFEREDLIISRDNIFPFEVHWSRKSESVKRILDKWNLGADSVVFIDDSAMEVDEVKRAFPEMECELFPKTDYHGLWNLFHHLRDLFGKSSISEEDSLRLNSIRASVESRESSAVSLDQFLQESNASLKFTLGRQIDDRRAFELINKTNQFNLNGKRLSDADWTTFLNDQDTFLMTIAYEDKYGPLGKIAVLLAKQEGRALRIAFWVMSCRAFSRRIEYQCLKHLFEKFDVEEIYFDYQPTPRNIPLQEFFSQLLGIAPEPGLQISRSGFFERMPPLFQQVEEMRCG